MTTTTHNPHHNLLTPMVMETAATMAVVVVVVVVVMMMEMMTIYPMHRVGMQRGPTEETSAIALPTNPTPSRSIAPLSFPIKNRIQKSTEQCVVCAFPINV